MNAFRVPIWTVAVERARQKFYDSWTPQPRHIAPPWVSLGKVLRFHRTALRRALRLPVTFGNIAALDQALTTARAALHQIASGTGVRQPVTIARRTASGVTLPDLLPDSLWRPLSAVQLVAIYRLRRLLRSANSRLGITSNASEVQRCLEQDLFRLFTDSILFDTHPVFGSDANDVLCTFDRNLIRNAALHLYVQSCSFDPDGIVSVVRFPRWVCDLFTALKWCNIPPGCSPPSARQVNDVYSAIRRTTISLCCDVPPPDVLTAALALWSLDTADLYHDIGAAVLAAQRLLK